MVAPGPSVEVASPLAGSLDPGKSSVGPSATPSTRHTFLMSPMGIRGWEHGISGRALQLPPFPAAVLERAAGA